jgi:hypothetical protein
MKRMIETHETRTLHHADVLVLDYLRCVISVYEPEMLIHIAESTGV